MTKKRQAGFGEPVYWNKEELVKIDNADPAVVEATRKYWPYDNNAALDLMTIEELKRPGAIERAVGRTNFTMHPVCILAEDGRVEAVLLDYAMFRVYMAEIKADLSLDIACLRDVDPRPVVA